LPYKFNVKYYIFSEKSSPRPLGEGPGVRRSRVGGEPFFPIFAKTTVMKKIGLVGGLGPEATLEYYRGIIEAFKSGDASLNYPEIIIYSVNMSELIGMMNRKEYDGVVDMLLRVLQSLRDAGAEFAAISANTPHLVFDKLVDKSPLHLISIVEATCEKAISQGLKKPGLFGTGFTMAGTFYQDVFTRKSISLSLPTMQDKEIINRKLFSEIELGIFRVDTRQLLIGIIDKMVHENGIDSMILGCTEFPLILTEPSYAGIPMLNTTQIHIDAIVDYCRK
jgi:aspartate racemase